MQTKPNPNWSSSLLRSDPRYYQIAALFSLLIYGVGWLGFDIEWPQIVISLGTVLLTQYACTRIFRLPAFDPRSPDHIERGNGQLYFDDVPPGHGKLWKRARKILRPTAEGFEERLEADSGDGTLFPTTLL